MQSRYKNEGYQKIFVFVFLLKNTTRKNTTHTRFENCTIIYQEIRLPCKNDQSYCDPTTRTQATIVWFPVDICTTSEVAKIHARMIKFHEKHFIKSILFDNVNPSQI